MHTSESVTGEETTVCAALRGGETYGLGIDNIRREVHGPGTCQSHRQHCATRAIVGANMRFYRVTGKKIHTLFTLSMCLC
jgi:hypothetical protein